MSLRIVAVAALDAAKLEAEVSSELGRAAPSRSLGSVDGLVALEWRVPGEEDEAGRLRARLADMGHPVDTAVLPANSGRKRLLISDMDSTIIGQECLDELADFAGLKAEVSAITERAMRGELDFEGALTTRVAMLKGLGLDALEQAYSERITLNPGAKTLVETMKADGAETVLVSGGFTYFTSRVAAAAGFHTHRGNTLIDDGKALTGEVGRPIPWPRSQTLGAGRVCGRQRHRPRRRDRDGRRGQRPCHDQGFGPWHSLSRQARRGGRSPCRDRAYGPSRRALLPGL
jgi:phosphoserine phosphatase